MYRHARHLLLLLRLQAGDVMGDVHKETNFFIVFIKGTKEKGGVKDPELSGEISLLF